MIVSIICDDSSVNFLLDGRISETIAVRAFSPALGEEKLLGERKVEISGSSFTLPRYEFGRDGANLRYETPLGGVKYAESVASENVYPFPNPGSKKGLQISDIKDAVYLGVKHVALNISIGDLLRRVPTEETETYIYDGREYYIDKKIVSGHDRHIKAMTDAGILVNLILLNGKRWEVSMPEDMKSVLLHPDYDDEGTLSGFNVLTDDGVRHYEAFVAFLAQRYSRPDAAFGRINGMIISNEVTSQWVWGNSGEKTVEEFAKEYTTALREAYLTAAKYSSAIRVYVSMDHFWGCGMDVNQPKRYYGGLPLLTEITKLSHAEGNFPWNIAHHPYPQDLTKPDFWNDDLATFTPDTEIITFKNLRVLADFLYKEENLYNGARRRVILSEQGFNSKWTPESEVLQATAYGRAYRTVMEIPEIDSFILHAYRDSKEEFGLNLGILRRKPDSDEVDRPKPAYYLFRAIDQKDDTGKYVWERF